LLHTSLSHTARFTLLALALAGPVLAKAKEWYEHYAEANRLVRAGKCDVALRSLREAVRLKSRSEVPARTYGLEFVEEYVPYYQQGVCHLRLGDYNAAVQMFNTEEEQGAIKKKPNLLRELVRQRGEAEQKAREERENTEQQRRAQVALAEVNRLRREAEEHYKEGKLEEARSRLASAQEVAKILEPEILQQIVERARRIREESSEKQALTQRGQDIERGLAEGRRLLESDPTQAKLRFEEVLRLDSQNAAALDGQREANAGILVLTTRQERQSAFREGKALFDQGRFEEAQVLLARAAADLDNVEAVRLLMRSQRLLDGVRREKALRVKIEEELAKAERLLAASEYSKAMVTLEGLLELDPSHVRAQEKMRLAARMTGDTFFEKIFPNQAPTLVFFESPPSEVQGASLALLGMATDDRGLVRLEYRHGGAVAKEEGFAPDSNTGQYPQTQKFQHVFELAPGRNEVAVAAYDTRGVAHVQSFPVTRTLRFYETRAFLPAAAGGALGLLGLGLAVHRLQRRRAIARRFNPYIAGAPVLADDMFFGRQKLLARILNVLHHNSLMITGERRIGKTTFLYHLKKALESDQASDYRFFPIFTDLQGVSEEDFFHSVMADAVEALDLPAEVRASLRFRPDSVAYEGRDFSHDLQRVIEELKTRTSKRVKLALLIDEVDVLNEFSERINQRLRGIFMKTFSEHLVAVMSGVGIRRIWTSEGSPWYNFFDEIELTGFTRAEAEALIREPVAGVFRYEPEAVEAILAASQLKPYVIQKLCIHAVNHMLELQRSVVRLEDVEAGREALGREEDEGGPRPAPVRRAPAGSVAD
jgi:tetratricopeptide (TPR) repeat protein